MPSISPFAPSRNCTSNVLRSNDTTSPFGSALMGAASGQEIVYEAPGGNFRYVVVGFEPHTG